MQPRVKTVPKQNFIGLLKILLPLVMLTFYSCNTDKQKERNTSKRTSYHQNLLGSNDSIDSALSSLKNYRFLKGKSNVTDSTTNTSVVKTRDKISKADSLILQRHVRDILCLGSGLEMGCDSTLSQDDLDSMYFEFNQTSLLLYDSHVVYAPDSTFKFFVYTKEVCGAYCYAITESFIHYNLKHRVLEKNIDVGEIYDIKTLNDGKYLILYYDGGRSGSLFTTVCVKALLASFAGDDMVIHPILYKDHEKLEICTIMPMHMSATMEPGIQFDKEKQLLTYQYGKDNVSMPGIDTIRTGSFQYIDGRFVFQEETYEVIKHEVLQE